ncbi:hypothetical protein Sm713_43890 [Streptomyces sp. TS71-3]|nr:hypothetical protein Sm713_43890 [Streptomyces sp. TS71-3]
MPGVDPATAPPARRTDPPPSIRFVPSPYGPGTAPFGPCRRTDPPLLPTEERTAGIRRRPPPLAGTPPAPP